MIIDGILGSEAIDSSGEILDVKGADISDWEAGTMLLNWEHEPGEKGASTLVGKVIYAKKIYEASDCEDDRQKMYWERVKVPFIYGVCRLWDSAGHDEAKAIAAIIRDCAANDEPIVVRFSVEGSTLEKEDNKLKSTVIRRIAVTVKPCNRTAYSGLLRDEDAPEGFEKEPVKEAEDILASIVEETETAEKSEHPLYTKLGGSAFIEDKTWAAEEAFAKTLTAGGASGAPSTWVGGAALASEHMHKRKMVKNAIKAAVRDYKPEYGDFRKFVKSRMPQVSEELRNSLIKETAEPTFLQLAESFQGLLKADDVIEAPKPKKAKAAAAPKPESEPKPSRIPKIKPKKAPASEGIEDSEESEDDLEYNAKEPCTINGVPIPRNPHIRAGKEVFDEETGVLHTAAGSFEFYNPMKDSRLQYAPGSQELEDLVGRLAHMDATTAVESLDIPKKHKDGDAIRQKTYDEHYKRNYDYYKSIATSGNWYKDLCYSPRVQTSWMKAMNSWMQVHTLLKNGKLPEAFIAAMVAFSQLSPNTPVPVNERMFSSLLDVIHGTDQLKGLGFDIRDPRWGEDFEDLHAQAMRIPNPVKAYQPLHPTENDKKGNPRAKKAREMTPEEHKRYKEDQIRYETESKAVHNARMEIYRRNEAFRKWMDLDTPDGIPFHARDWHKENIEGITNQNASKTTGRKAGELTPYMLPVNKFRNMARYAKVHSFLVDLFEKHGIDGQAIVADLMKAKVQWKKWDKKRKDWEEKNPGQKYSEPEPPAVPGLRPKTGAFSVNMSGTGNQIIVDTHMARSHFGLDKAKDTNSIALVRNNIFWKEEKIELAQQLCRHWMRNHPAMDFVVDHPDPKIHNFFKNDRDSAAFAAMWLHWTTIAMLEQALGHAKAAQASNVSDHRPAWMALDRIMNDPEEAKKVVRTKGLGKTEFGFKMSHIPMTGLQVAGLIDRWRQGEGDMGALYRYYTELVPHMLATSNQPSTPTAPAQEQTTPAVRPDIKNSIKAAVRDYKSEHGDFRTFLKNRLPEVDESYIDHFVETAKDYKAKLSKAENPILRLEKASVMLQQAAAQVGTPPKSSVIDANLHQHPNYPLTDEQKALVHGIDLSKPVGAPAHAAEGINSSVNNWYKAGNTFAYVKPQNNRHADDNFNEPHREAAYHDMAKNFFGLGEHVPTTALVVDPRDSSKVLSVQKMAQDAGHAESDQFSGWDARQPLVPHQEEAIAKLGDNGTLDKLALMNLALGNFDRHTNNYLISHEAPHLHLIDHGFAFPERGLEGLVPGYLYHYAERKANRLYPNMEQYTLHPQATNWLLNLDADEMGQRLAKNRVPPHLAAKAQSALKAMQAKLAQNPATSINDLTQEAARNHYTEEEWERRRAREDAEIEKWHREREQNRRNAAQNQEGV